MLMITMVSLVFRILLFGSAACLLAFPSPDWAQGDLPAVPADTLATIGPRAITARDLIERIELMPWQGKDNPGTIDSAKIRALQSLVAEQILAMEASTQGIVDDNTYRAYARYVEKLMVRDELYRREVREKVSVSPEEIAQGLKRFARQIRALMITVGGDEDDANEVARTLKRGARLDSLVRARRLTVDTAQVKFGMLEKGQEDAVYALSASKKVSEPVNVPRLGWVVLQHLGSETDPEYAKLSLEDRTEAVKQKIRRRKEAARAAVYVSGILGKEKAGARPATFEMLADTLHEMFEKDSVLYRNEYGYRLDKVAGAAGERLASHLRDVLVDLDEGALTIQDVLEGWKNFDFLIPSLERRSFLAHLNGAIREVVAREYLAREGYRRGLHQSAAVRRDVETWMNAWLASELTRKLMGGSPDLKRLDAHVASVARNHSVTLYYDRLKQLLISPFNMVVKRFIGFGGTMPASPGLVPVYRWVEEAKGVKQIFP